MSEAVLADAQFGNVRVFRPFLGFEKVYQGLPVTTPIAIPGNLDPDAGKTGFASNLIAGIPLPLGAKMKAWIPTIFQQVEGESELVVHPYRYRFIWRVRNLGDFRRTRVAYHFPRQTPGSNNQFVVPSAAKVALYENQPQNYATNSGDSIPSLFSSILEARQSAVIESFEFGSAIADPPRISTGAIAAYQQGIAASAGVGNNATVSFNIVEMDVDGDELIILVSRNYDPQSETRFWDFTSGTGMDSGFSAFFGTDDGARAVIRDMGIYLMTGSSP